MYTCAGSRLQVTIKKNLNAALIGGSHLCQFIFLCLLSRPGPSVGYRRLCERSYKVFFGEKVDHLLFYSFCVNDVILFLDLLILCCSKPRRKIHSLQYANDNILFS